MNQSISVEIVNAVKKAVRQTASRVPKKTMINHNSE